MSRYRKSLGRLLLVVPVALACATAVVSAQETQGAQQRGAGADQRTGPVMRPDAKPNPVTPEKEAQIRKLLELTHVRRNAADFGHHLGESFREMMDERLPDGPHNQQIEEVLVGKLVAHLDSDEFIVKLIPVYDSEFTEQDLKSILQFYDTPAGRKMLDAMPRVLEASNNVSDAWVQELLPQIITEMGDQFPELRQIPGEQPER
jgi:hypothetical protein